jgi:hypothetical protein
VARTGFGNRGTRDSWGTFDRGLFGWFDGIVVEVQDIFILPKLL